MFGYKGGVIIKIKEVILIVFGIYCVVYKFELVVLDVSKFCL